MKNFLVLLLLTLSFSSYAQVKHLVLDIDGFLIQGIPLKNVNSLSDKERVLKTNEGGRDRYYYPAPYAAEVLRSLHSLPHVVIHFVTATHNRSWLQSVLNKIYVNRAKGITLENFIEADQISSFQGSEDLTADGKIDLRKISSDLKNVFYFTSKKDQLVIGQESQEILTGQSYYVFETYALAQAELMRIGDNVNLPKSDDDWYLERYRFPKINAAVRQALKKKSSFITELRQALSDKNRDKVSLGIKQIRDNWKEIGPRFSLNSGRINGCAEYNNIEDFLLRALNLNDCLKDLPTEFRLITTTDAVKGCGHYSTEHNQLVKEVAMSTCVDKLNFATYWDGRNRTSCFYYTNNYLKVAPALASKCDNLHVMLNPFNEKLELVEEVENFDNLSLDEIFNRFKPTLQEVFQLWAPYDNDSKMGFSIQGCRVPAYGHHTIKEGAYGLIDDCKPDTLYSWGPVGKKDNLEQWMGSSGSWVKSIRPLFMVRSPVGSFGYGIVPIRIKLKSNLNWERTDESHLHCDSVSEAKKQNTVFYRPYKVRSDAYLLDYTVCAPGPIASWSYAHKQHYDEIVKEYSWIKIKPETEFELYISGANALSHFYSGVDGYNFSEGSLVNYLRNMLNMIDRKEGKIHWNPSVPNSQRTLNEHFKTSVPMYYNHN
jgi:hypothetical protein